jgi:AraC-like DNA-binding protein
VDVLSEVLADLRLQSTLYAHFRCGAPWSVEYGALPGYHVVTEGACLLERDGSPPLRLEPGDFVVLPRGAPHRLRAMEGPGVPVPVQTLTGGRTHSPAEPIAVGAGGAATRYLCGALRFEDGAANPVLAALPEVIHVRAEEGRMLPWLEMTLQAMSCEARSGRPGAEIVLARLSDVLFVQAIRSHLVELSQDAPGWLAASRDPQVARVLWLLHRNPEREWTVGSMAGAVYMSRSAFAERFHRLVGQPPLTYLSTWRMHLAARMLRGDNARLAAVADRLGYGSEAAFSTAFRKRYGVSPGAYRRGRVPAAAD